MGKIKLSLLSLFILAATAIFAQHYDAAQRMYIEAVYYLDEGCPERGATLLKRGIDVYPECPAFP